jgi:hypothetical protein
MTSGKTFRNGYENNGSICGAIRWEVHLISVAVAIVMSVAIRTMITMLSVAISIVVFDLHDNPTIFGLRGRNEWHRQAKRRQRGKSKSNLTHVSSLCPMEIIDAFDNTVGDDIVPEAMEESFEQVFIVVRQSSYQPRTIARASSLLSIDAMALWSKPT